MHSLSVIIGPAIWVLAFKTEEKAREIHTYIADHAGDADTRLVVTDDFGQTMTLRCASVHGLLLEDLDVSKEAVIERMIHNAKVQAEAQAKASRDSSLRHAAHGPAVLSPGMMSRFS